jgi:hypothetical protein
MERFVNYGGLAVFLLMNLGARAQVTRPCSRPSPSPRKVVDEALIRQDRLLLVYPAGAEREWSRDSKELEGLLNENPELYRVAPFASSAATDEGEVRYSVPQLDGRIWFIQVSQMNGIPAVRSKVRFDVIQELVCRKYGAFVERDAYQFSAHPSIASTSTACATYFPPEIVSCGQKLIHDRSGLSAKDVTIAIVDSGIASHYELPGIKSGKDSYGHGTFQAGVIAASHDWNGVFGIVPDVKLLDYPFLDSGGQGDTADAIKAISYAANKANIVLLSWGTSVDEQQALLIEIQKWTAVLFVAAAGNYGNEEASTPVYPAAYPEKNLISVMAVTCDSKSTGPAKPAGFSDYGSQAVDVAAPGDGAQLDDITCSTGLNNRYGRMIGTSVAAAYVAAEAGVITQRMHDTAGSFPAPLDVKAAIMNNVMYDSALQCRSHGVIDLAKAVP